MAELQLSPGTVVVDVGCGPGTDLAAMTEVGCADGLVIGLDVDPQMLVAAAGRVPAVVALAAGDAHQLPLTSASVDRVRTDRALQHMHDPTRVLAEFFRVLRPGGIAVLAEPDWGTFVVDASRGDVSRRFVDFTCYEVVRNDIVGREVGRLGVAAGFVAMNVAAFPTVIRDFASADKIFGLTRNALAAVEAGYINRTEAEAWLVGLKAGPMLAAVTLFVTTLAKAR